MAGIMMFPNQSGGFDAANNLLVIPTYDSAAVYLVAGADLAVSVFDPSLVTATAGAGDDRSAHNRAGTDQWTNAQNIRKITLKSNGAKGTTKLVARTAEGHDFIAPLTIYVVANKEARRTADKGEIEPALRVELQKLPLRQAVLRVAEDQLHSRVTTNAQGIALYHLPEPNKLWCGAFAYWCWDQACIAKGVANPFGSSNDPLLSPQKAIHWGVNNTTAGQLLQYEGWDPMVVFSKQSAPQELRENGYMGAYVQPADIALWRSVHATDFKHVSFVASVNGTSFSDYNGNAYDAGSGSALALIGGHEIKKKLGDNSYKTFFLHVRV